MLNLSIAMLKLPLFFSLILLMQAANISITSPQAGETLYGQVDIAGNMDVPNFASAELAFSYAVSEGGADSDSAESWFAIRTFPQPAQSQIIAVWDTTTVTDGDYILHMRVYLQDGSSQDVAVSNLKIRNDIPDSIKIDILPQSIQSAAVSQSPVATIESAPLFPSFPSSTPLPLNPVSVTPPSIYSSFARGGFIALVFFILFSILLRLRKN